MRCLLILAHPRFDSLCGALFDACADGARQAGVECRELILSEIRFDPDVHAVSPEQQALEPDLVRAQRDIDWAEHLVFVYPTWWGTFPALLKGFLDRVVTPVFAFRHVAPDKWDKLLAGRTPHHDDGHAAAHHRYERELNRNLIGRPEFFALGFAATVQLGWASTGLGSSRDALLHSGSVSRGFEPALDHTLIMSAKLSGQFSIGQVRRQRLGAQAQYYLPQGKRWLFYAAASADMLTRPDPAEALLLGGDNGLRGYPLRRRGILRHRPRLWR